MENNCYMYCIMPIVYYCNTNIDIYIKRLIILKYIL